MIIATFIFVATLAFDSGAWALTDEAKDVGLSLAKKLDSLMGHSKIGGSFRSSNGHLPSDSDVSYLDIMLVLDSSGSIGHEDFIEAKEATALIVDYVDEKAPISRVGSRVGLIQYSSSRYTRVVFTFDDYRSGQAVNRAINRLRYTKGSTATGKALRLAYREFNRNVNSGNARIVWLLTDGKSNRGNNPVTEANRLRNMGVTVCAVAIGRKVKMSEIYGIADEGCVYQVSSFGTFRAAMSYASKYADKSSDRSSTSPSVRSPAALTDFFNGLRLRK